MYKSRLLIAALSAGLLLTACRKTDLQKPTITGDIQKEFAGSWKPLAWTSQQQENNTVHNGSVHDENISASVASDGLVLVYMKDAKSITALPVEDKADGQVSFWYYQVSEGRLEIISDVNGIAKAPGNDVTFKYFVVTPEQLNQLEKDGHSKARLMDLSFEAARELLR